MKSKEEIHIWDLFVRVFHWVLVVLVFSNLFFTEEGETVHEWVGYLCFVLVMLRVVWGFIGSENARFNSFFPTICRIKEHINDMRYGTFHQAEGHNPLGGAMVLILMSLILLLGLSGFLLEEVDFFFGEEWLEEIHEAMAELLQVLVFVHITAVFVMQKYTGIELVKPMITGKRKVRLK